MRYNKLNVSGEKLDKVRSLYWFMDGVEPYDNLSEKKHYMFNIYIPFGDECYSFETHMVLNYREALKIHEEINLRHHIHIHHVKGDHGWVDDPVWIARMDKFFLEVARECESDSELKNWLLKNLRSDDKISTSGMCSFQDLYNELLNVVKDEKECARNELNTHLLHSLLKFSVPVIVDANMRLMYDEPIREGDFVLKY